MRDKKKVFALVLFILMGFFMFTFANPSDGIDSLTTPANKNEDKENEEVKEVTKISDNNPQLIVAVDNAPTITVTPKELKIIRGVDFDVTTGVVVTDDKDVNLKPVISMTSMLNAEIGVYTLTYTVTDSGNNTRTTTRTIKVLEPDADEDNDGYTNKEEYDNDSNFDNEDEFPTYDKAPSITINEDNVYSMEINSAIPKFAATAKDEADGDIEVTIDNNIDKTVVGTYEVTFTAVDVLKNKTEITKEFTVVDTTAPVISDIKNSSNGNWTNKMVTVSWDINETGAGLKTVQYCYSSDCTDWKNLQEYEYSGFSRSEERNNVVYIRAIDKSDNISNVIALTFKIDKTKPTVTVRSDQDILESGSYYDLRKTIRIQPSDNNSRGKVFINDVEYKQYYGSSSFGINWIINGNNSTDTFNVVVYDEAGNKSDNFVINVDRTAPDGIISYSNNNGNDVTKDDVTVTLKTSETVIIPSSWNKVSDKEFTKVYSANGKYSVEIEDIYGNKKTLNYEVKRIDKNAPIFDGIANNGFYEKDLTYDIVKSKSNEVDFSIIEENFSSLIVDGISYSYKTAPKVVSGEGIHTIKVIDKAGNESETITITIDYPFTITQELSEELTNDGYRLAGTSQKPVVNKYYSKTKFNSFECVNDGETFDCQPVVWKDSNGNIVSKIEQARTVVSSNDMYYEANETFTAYPMGAIIEYRLSNDFINMGYKIGSSSTNSNQDGFSTTRTYYFNEPTKLVSFPYVNSGNGTYMVYNESGELVSSINGGLTKPIVYNHIVTGHEIYTIVPLMFNVVFKDYDGTVLSNQTVMANHSYTAPVMTGKTYTSKKGSITYTFNGWDKNVSSVTSDLTINANYDITNVTATLYELDKDATRPTSGGGLPESKYKKLGTIDIKTLDDIKNIIIANNKHILTYDLASVITYVNDQTALPIPTDKDENFTKYEFYVLKFEPDGWHIDCQAVIDITVLNSYRNSAISQINSYASVYEFDVNSAEITGIVNASGISNLNTKSSIDAAVVSAKNAIDSLFAGTKTAAKNLIQTAINSQLLKNNYLIQANSIRDNANTSIDNGLTISSINSLRDQAINTINNLKALSLKTFTATITNKAGDGDYKYLAVNDIASDIVITKVYFVYGNLFETLELKYTGDVYNPSLLVNARLQYADKVRIEYTKNGINYLAKYYVDRDWSLFKGTYIVGLSKYADTYSA